jgi:N-sulfoglucosamine sulfohydrolase
MRPWTIASAALVLLLGSSLPAAQPRARNVVLIVADDLGFQLGCYGDKKIHTPHIDALAKQGTRFTHAFTTVSSCSPSRASLYTGLYTHASGQYGLAYGRQNFHTRDDVTCLPRLVHRRKYHTGIVGKIHVLPKALYNFEVQTEKNININRSVAEMGEQARQFFKDSGDRPFALVVGFSDPHRTDTGFGNETPYPGVKEVRYQPDDVTVPYFLPDKPEVRQELTEYYQSISRLDKGVGFVLSALKDTGHTDDTLVIFLSDNGPPFPGAKTNLYDSGIHLPLIVSSPLQKKHGVVNQAMVSWIDILPTILDWTGVTAPPILTGRSLLPILDQEAPKGWNEVFGSHQSHEVTMYYPMRMIRTRSRKYIRNLAHKLDYPHAGDLYTSKTWQGILERGDKMLGDRTIESYNHRPLEELYDLESDPHELKNLAADPAEADVLADLRARLRAWQTKTRDPWLVKYQHE